MFSQTNVRNTKAQEAKTYTLYVKLKRMVRPLSRFCLSTIFRSGQVLWLGNSYTFYNDLPTMVARLAAAQGKSILYSNHTESSWSWQTHAESQLTMELIRSQPWDVVVLQEQSRKPAYPAHTVCEDSVRHLSSLVVAIKANNPETILQVSQPRSPIDQHPALASLSST